MIPYLRGQRLYGFVDGTSSSPSLCLPLSTTPNLACLQWLQQDQMILSALISSLTESFIAQVVGFSTARDVWVTLEFLFQFQSQSHLVHL